MSTRLPKRRLASGVGRDSGQRRDVVQHQGAVAVGELEQVTHRGRAGAQLGEVELDAAVLLSQRPQGPSADGQPNAVPRLGDGQGKGHPLRGAAGVGPRAAGPALTCPTVAVRAVVDRPGEFQNVAVLLEGGDQREHQRVVARVGQQPVRRVVGRGDQHRAAARKCVDEPRQQHRVAGVVSVEIVQEQQPHPGQHRVHRPIGRTGAAGLSGHLRVQLARGVVGVQPQHAINGQLLKQDVDQPGLAPPDRPVEVDPLRHTVPPPTPGPAAGQLVAQQRPPVVDRLLLHIEQRAQGSGRDVEGRPHVRVGRSRMHSHCLPAGATKLDRQ